MSSKNMQLATLFVLCGLVSSCAQEDQPYFNTPAIAPGGACIDNMADDVENYLVGQLHDNQVRRFWHCQKQALNAFYVSTQGQVADRHSSEELRNFFQSYFARHVQISERLMNEILELKSLMVGGDAHSITKAEMGKALQLFGHLEDLTLKLRPHIPVFREFLISANRQSMAQDQLAQALAAFNEFGQGLTAIIQANGKSYSLKNLEALINEVDALVVQTEGKSQLRELLPYLPLLEQSKAILLDSPSDTIGGNEWSLLGKKVASILRFLLLGENYIQQLKKSGEVDPSVITAMLTEGQALFVDPDTGAPTTEKLRMQQIDDLLDRMVELKILAAGNWVSMVKDGLRVLAPLLFGPNQAPGAIATRDWPVLIKTLITLSHEGLHFVQQPTPIPWYGARRWNHLKSFIEATFAALHESLPRHANGVIDHASLQPLHGFLIRHKLLPPGFTQEIAESTTQTLLDRVFVVTEDGDILPPQGGLSEQSLALIQGEYQRWIEAQEYINWLYGSKPPDIQTAHLIAFTPGALEMRDLASTPWPLRLDHFGRLTFLWHAEDHGRDYDHFSLTQLNWQRAIIRPLMRAYSRDSQRRLRPVYLTSEELKSLAKDAVPTIEAFGLPLQGNIAIYEKVFREANLFTPRAHKDDRLYFNEGIEYFSHVLSGTNAGRLAMEILKPSCHSSNSPEQSQSLEPSCFRVMSLLHQDQLLSHLPNLQAYLKKYNYSQTLWFAFEEEMENLVREDGYSSRPIQQGEISRMWILLQYIETIMGRFDTDGDGDLNHSEMWSIYEELLNKPSEDFSLSLIANARADSGLNDLSDLRPLNRPPTLRPPQLRVGDANDPFSMWKMERYRLLKFIGWMAAD